MNNVQDDFWNIIHYYYYYCPSQLINLYKQ